MEHKIKVESIASPQAGAMTHAISTCVHCGFCLPACPTYRVLGEEMDSPRGRIVLMRGVLEETLPLADAAPYLDRCLGCLGCVTACPSGVPYGELISSFRAHTEPQRTRPMVAQLARTMSAQTLPHAWRFRWAAFLGRFAKPLRRWFPANLSAMLGLIPDRIPTAVQWPTMVPAIGPRRGSVGLLVGCVQQVIAPEINQATIYVLAQNGFDVVIPPGQSCCGALHMHTGNASEARKLAKENFSRFLNVDAIITNAAGCGSGIKEYSLLFRGHPQEREATEFSSKVQDVSEFLDHVSLIPPRGDIRAMRVAYHDACHLAHAQSITDAPRRLLRQIPGLDLVEIPDGEICCGSAGTYNIEQPQIAETLGAMKAQNVATLSVDAVAMGNIGCMVQIRKHLSELSLPASKIEVVHTMQLLAKAYGMQNGNT
jgi:glycolate oxidase iron-sulfur subunit